MGINTERDIEANMQIGPTDQGFVRIFIEADGKSLLYDTGWGTSGYSIFESAVMPKRPSCPSFFHKLFGKVFSLSILSAIGAISFCANL